MEALKQIRAINALQHNFFNGLGFMINGKSATGLTRMLEEYVWKGYHYPTEQRAPVPEAAPSEMKKHYGRSRSKKYGRQLGSYVHRRMSLKVAKVLKPTKAIQRSIGSSGKLALKPPPKIDTKKERMGPYERAAFDHLQDTLQWRVIGQDIVVASLNGQIATAIDLVCTDARTGTKLYVVELKTNTNGSRLVDSSGKFMIMERLRHLENNARNQYNLQLAVTTQMLIDRYRVTPDRSIVLRTYDAGEFGTRAESWDLPADFGELAGHCLHTLLQRHGAYLARKQLEREISLARSC